MGAESWRALLAYVVGSAFAVWLAGRARAWLREELRPRAVFTWAWTAVAWALGGLVALLCSEAWLCSMAIAVIGAEIALLWFGGRWLMRDDPGREARADALGVRPEDVELVEEMQEFAEQQLTRGERLVLMLIHHDGMCYEEVARTLDRDEEWVIEAQQKATALLRNHFGHRIYGHMGLLRMERDDFYRQAP